MRDYILEIFFDGDDEERIQSRLFLTKSTGSTSSEGLVSAYFDSAEDRAEAAALLNEFEVQHVERERVDWLEVYQQSLEPIVIGERFVVAPDVSLLPEGSDRLTIIVPQEQAFGTGSHETTSLCIEMLESLALQDKRGLDVGSGSGILAIAMLRLGASNVIAFDNDVDAYGALRDNNLRNGVAVTLFIGGVEALRGGAFDVVTMNIIPEVILPLLPQVVSRMADGAQLILSGILTIARDTVVDAAQGNGLQLVRESEKGEWWVGVFRR
ncbi:MAG TPA: 50S ribosomal protein L11 methyltransferase [Thermoanaerobaculia bacterium]|nr:50S ribosomal protein L11 methyltransferase [Thermoanaerobaculia bacterium]